MSTRTARIQTVRTLHLQHLAAQTVAAFTERGIQVILLKGASFAQLFYPEGGRTYGDVDLLVPRSQFAAAKALLETAGFTTPPERPLLHATTFYRRNPRGFDDNIDLHWTLSGAMDAPDGVWSQLSRHTRTITVGGRRVDALDEVGCALQVALHAANHVGGVPGSGDIGCRTEADLDRALTILDADTWQQAYELAHALGIERAFAFGMRQTPRGAAHAESLALTTELPPIWALPCGRPARGAGTINRILCPGSARERFGPMLAALWPPAAICRARARSRLGRRYRGLARFEWWWGLVRDVLPAMREGRRRIG